MRYPVGEQHRYEDCDDDDDTMGKGNLNVFSGMCLVMGLMIGSGIFSTPGKVVELAGSPAMAMGVWMIGGFITFCGTFSYIELGTMLSKNGGEQAYLEAAFQTPKALISFMFCWSMILCIRPGSEAADSIIFAKYIVYPFAENISQSVFIETLIAIAGISSITIINAFSTKIAVIVHDALTLIKVATLLFISTLGILIATGAVSIVTPTSNFAKGLAGSHTNPSNYASAFYLVFWAYDGWNNLNYAAGELRDPVKSLPKAAGFAVLFVTSLYLLANFAYFTVIPLELIVSSSELFAGEFFKIVFGNTYGSKVFPVLLALSSFGAVSAMVFSAGRVIHAAANAGVIPMSSYFKHVHPKFKTPIRCLMLNWSLCVIYIAAPPQGSVFNFLIDLVSYPTWVFYGLSVIGLLWMRVSQPRLVRPFKVWLPLTVLFILASCFLVGFPFVPVSTTEYPYFLPPLIGIVIIVSAIPIWAIFVRNNDQIDPNFGIPAKRSEQPMATA